MSKFGFLIILLSLTGCDWFNGGSSSNPPKDIYSAEFALARQAPVLEACDGQEVVEYLVSKCFKNGIETSVADCQGFIKLPEVFSSPAGTQSEDIVNYKDEVIGQKTFSCEEGQNIILADIDVSCTDSRYIKQNNNGELQCNPYFKQLQPFPITSEDKYYILKSLNNPCKPNGWCVVIPDEDLGKPLYSANVQQIWRRQNMLVEPFPGDPLEYRGGGLVMLLTNGRFISEWDIIDPRPLYPFNNNISDKWTANVVYTPVRVETMLPTEAELNNVVPGGFEIEPLSMYEPTGVITLKLIPKISSQSPSYYSYPINFPYKVWVKPKDYKGWSIVRPFTTGYFNCLIYPSSLQCISSSSEWFGLKTPESSITHPEFYNFYDADGDVTNTNEQLLSIFPTGRTLKIQDSFTMDEEGKQMCYHIEDNLSGGTYCYTYKTYPGLLSIEKIWNEPVKVYNRVGVTCIITNSGDLHCRKELSWYGMESGNMNKFSDQEISVNYWKKINVNPIEDIHISHSNDIYLLGKDKKLYMGSSEFKRQQGYNLIIKEAIPFHEGYVNSFKNDAHYSFDFSVFE